MSESESRRVVTMFRRARKPSPRRPDERVTTYRRILVPLAASHEPDRAIALACRLAAEHRASVTALSVIEVPMMVPMDAYMIEEEAAAKELLERARAAAHSYEISCSTRIVRDRNAGEAIVREAVQHNTEMIILSARRRPGSSGRTGVFGRTVRFVLAHAPCRVMVTAPPPVTTRVGVSSA